MSANETSKITITLKDILNNVHTVEVDPKMTIHKLSILWNELTSGEFVDRFYLIESNPDESNKKHLINWGDKTTKKTLADENVIDKSLIVVISGDECHPDFPMSLNLILCEMGGQKYTIEVYTNTTMHELAALWFKASNKYVAEFYSPLNGEDPYKWFENKSKTTMAYHDFNNEYQLFVVCGNLPRLENSDDFYLSCCEMGGINIPLKVTLSTKMSELAKIWNQKTGKFAAEFYSPEFGEEPFNWGIIDNERTIGANNLQQYNQIFVICNDKTINENLFEHKIIYSYCDTCDDSFFWHGNCMTCMSNSGIDICEHCFSGNSFVKLENGQFKRISDLLAGEVVESGSITGFSMIQKILKTPAKYQRDMCTYNGIDATADHPVWNGNKWIYPRDVKDIYNYTMDLYNFEMVGKPYDKSRHTIMLYDESRENSSLWVTLGHGPDNLKIRDPDADAIYGTGYWNCKDRFKSVYSFI